MDDHKTEAELMREGAELRRRVAELEAALAEARQTAQRLRENDNRFRLLVESMTDLVGLIGPNEERFYISPSFFKATGFTPEEIQATDFRTRVHPDDLELVERAREANLRGEATRIEYRARRKDGSYFWLEIQATPILDSEGRVEKIVRCSRDVTQRKKMLDAIQEEQRTLRRSLQLHDLDRRLIAYEIHDGAAQHLAAAQMYLRAADPQASLSPEEKADFYGLGLDLLRMSLAELRQVISGLRMGTLEDFGLASAVEELVDQSAEQGGPAIELANHCREARFPMAIENSAFRILQELLTNARRHSQSERVRLDISRDEKHVRLEVQDWGVGFDPQKLPPTSFGLRGVRERTQLLGGQLSVESAPGQGTKVCVLLPVVLDS